MTAQSEHVLAESEVNIKDFLIDEYHMSSERIHAYHEMLKLTKYKPLEQHINKLLKQEVQRSDKLQDLMLFKVDTLEAQSRFKDKGNSLRVGTGCEIKQLPYGIYIDGIKQEGAIDVQIKKNSYQWIEVQITYMANSFFKERV